MSPGRRRRSKAICSPQANIVYFSLHASFSLFAALVQKHRLMLMIKKPFPFCKREPSPPMVVYLAMHNGYVYIIYIYNNRKIWISLVDMYHKKDPKNSYIRFRLAVKYSQCPLIYSSREDKCGTPDSRKGFASRSGTIN